MNFPGLRKLFSGLMILSLMAGLGAGSACAETLSKQGKNWQVNFTTQFIHDSNLTQKPDGNPLVEPLFPQGSASGLNWDLNGTYVHKVNERFRLTANYDIEMNKWDTFDQFDTLSQMFGLKPSYKINSNWFASGQYFFIWNHAGGYDLSQDTFSTVHYLNPSLHHMSKRWGMTRMGVRYSYNNNHVTSTRDTNTVGFTLDHLYQVKKGVMLGVGYGYRYQNAALARFQRGIHDFKAKVKASLIMGVDFLGGYRFSLRDYNNNFSSSQDFLTHSAGTFERRDSQHNISLELRKMLALKMLFMRNVRANIRWVRQVNDSNFGFRDFSSNIFSIGLTTQF